MVICRSLTSSRALFQIAPLLVIAVTPSPSRHRRHVSLNPSARVALAGPALLTALAIPNLRSEGLAAHDY
jgi:hypothetical protein